jgi:hypothetical protein
MTDYFTDRELPSAERTNEHIEERVWAAILGLIDTRLNDNSFGYGFPESCPDGMGPCGCDRNNFALMLEGEIPWITWPLRPSTVPDTPIILDVLEFCAAAVGTPIEGGWHPYFSHYHLSWDRDDGLDKFIATTNRLFRRNGIAFELDVNGKARRVMPEPMRQLVTSARFHTGDDRCDELLNTARDRIMRPKPEERREALEKLWDAFERIKTLEAGDKKAAATALLSHAAAPDTIYRTFLDSEARSLTDIGNTLGIRHSETQQEYVSGNENIDYLFTRMFAFIYLVAKKSGRAT